ncbi:MAG: ribose-5-phosphate isomerase [Chthoniobacterales bacterium]|nr:ribose-5-phosphate isomerase [Chthoniobacterales bacterium]MCX7713221.1 ribose-5-phosphate isomerase [Chthoniobacterales bacterium]
MKIAIGSDHAGYSYKTAIIEWLRKQGHEVLDFGTHSPDPADYPLYVIPAAEAVAQGKADRAVVLGGSGNGEAIAANKVKGIRCALCWNTETAELARRHNNANAISLGERMISLQTALEILHVWLNTDFDGGRHSNRIAELDQYEKTGSLPSPPINLNPK